MIIWIIIWVLIILISLVIGIILHKKIEKGNFGKKPYTKLTMWMVILYFMSVIILSGNLLLNAILIENQMKAISQIDPDLIVKLDNEESNKMFMKGYIIGLSHDDNWSFWPIKLNVDMIAINNGQRSTGDAHFYLKDPSGNFKTTSISREIEPLDFQYMQFYMWHKDCYGGTGKGDYFQRIRDGCDPETLETELMKLILIVECKPCKFERNPQCYSFDICVYNNYTEEGICEEKLADKEFTLKPTECPEDYYA
jgi:hypothetical protein